MTGLHAQPYIEQLVLVGYRDAYDISDAAAGGACEVRFEVPADEYWLVDRMSLTNTSTTPTTAAVYVGDAAARNLRATTETGNLDSAEGTPVYAEAGRPVLVVWSGCSAGAVGTAVIEYRQMAKRGGFQ